MAQTWDLFRGNTSQWEDRFFFLDLIRTSGEPVLDVGCGTGRLLLDYLSLGIDADGLDNSAEMLGLCRQKATAMGLKPTLYEDSMERMCLPRRYQTIIVPSSSFQLVLDPGTAREAILCLFNQLLPGGILVMPFMLLWKRGNPLVADWRMTGERVRPEDGACVRRWSYSRYDPDAQLEHTKDRYEIFIEGVKVAEEFHERSPATREYTQAQAMDLYRKAGFDEIHVYKGFSLIPASIEDELFSITGRKP